VHLTETCDAGRPHLITQVTTMPAPSADSAVTTPIQQALERKGLLPGQQIVDTGYVDAGELRHEPVSGGGPPGAGAPQPQSSPKVMVPSATSEIRTPVLPRSLYLMSFPRFLGRAAAGGRRGPQVPGPAGRAGLPGRPGNHLVGNYHLKAPRLGLSTDWLVVNWRPW